MSNNLVIILEQVKTLIVQEGETNFEKLKKSTKQTIFDLVQGASSDLVADGDDGDICVNFAFSDYSGVSIQFWGHGEYADMIRNNLSAMYLDEGQSDDTVAVIDKLIAELSGPVQVVNLTPHEIVIVDDAGAVTSRFPASGQIARVNSRAVDLPPVASVPAVRTEYGAIDGLPEQQPGTIYLVSIVVAQALRKLRPDVYVPDTGPGSVVRDADGKIIGVKRFMQL